ncbi:hypothetical protein C8F04DRAFT_1216912 [Mycena alexandri]|uniref:Uncharacterized protein n=1 Tax=Mycena alexandri TaxID=1745969 RepID=A0AAD6XF28_9AGAR|nr:hypothetical protein C8F04DRAFT_1216912 [Mycena alexandri]
MTYKSANSNAGPSTARPQLARQETDLLASYYESPIADQGIGYRSPPPTKRPVHRRSLSGNSTSSSDYSSSGSTSDHSIEEVKPVPPSTRRGSVPTEGGADRRRLAIVQMDPVPESDSPKSTVRTRRGLETRLEGLALVAPPDAAPKSYQFTPPTSAPPNSSRSMPHGPPPEDKGHNRSASEATTRILKSKSSRDVGIVGTVASPTTSSAPLEPPKKLRLQLASESLLPVVFQEPHASRAGTPNTLATPLDGPSLSPLTPPQAPKRRSTELSIQSVHTPEIGQPKEIHVPVASPVVVNLGPDASLRVGNSSFDRRSPALQVVEPRDASPTLPLSSYLHYQPGVHATAGPLPPPPRAVFNIDPATPPPPRPPRLNSPPPRPVRRGELDAVKQALQLPASVSAVLGSSGSSTPSSRSISPLRPVDLTSPSSGSESADETHHRREGAFSPSVISSTPSTSPSDYSPTTAHPTRTIDGLVSDGSKSPTIASGTSSAVTSPMIIPAPPPRMESLPEHSAEDWTHISRDLNASPSSDGHMSQDRVSWESYSPPSQDGASNNNSTGPTPPPKSFKASLTTGLKRLSSSLPRTPSPSKSLARSSSTSTSTRSQRLSPSPPIVPVALPTPPVSASAPLPSIPAQVQMPPRRRKIIALHPSALISSDVATRKSAQERCFLYAQKINELYVHDCGLSEWVVEARFRGSNAPSKRSTLTLTSQRTTPGAPQPRNVSHSSTQSEATFPRRPDAMVATDLSTKPSDIVPVVPALPYPALSPRAMSVALPPASMRLIPTSPTSSKTGNFFASLGRKASMSKRERPPPTSSFSINPPTTGTRLTKNPPASLAPRPVLIASSPSVPGGPRAPPNRALRTQSIMPSPSPSPFSSNSSTSSDRSASMAARRPSVFTPGSSSASGGGGMPAPDFERQVDKLADLLPQAERAVLAGYLRRSGQDILAIGQYLEDEKNGTLRRD